MPEADRVTVYWYVSLLFCGEDAVTEAGTSNVGFRMVVLLNRLAASVPVHAYVAPVGSFSTEQSSVISAAAS